MSQPSSTVIEFKPSPGGLPASAEAWCARLGAEDLTEAERAAFERWLDASIDNRAEYELCALASGLARGLAQNPGLEMRQLPQRSQVEGAADPRRRRTRRALAAAAALSALALAALIGYWSRSTYVTDIGEQKLIALADGSTIQLNTASAVKVALQEHARRVVLSRGEAFFNVAADPARPFFVQAGQGHIRVLGTKFNVRVQDDDVSVTVTEGRVQVDGVEVLAGEGARVAIAEPVVKLVAVNSARLTSWREGRIYFDHDPLSKVLPEVNRYLDVQFVIGSEAAGALQLSGVFRTGDADSVAFALRETYGLKTERDGRHILVR